MSASLRLTLATTPVEQTVADVVVVSFFETDRPLRGAAGRADWRLCGMLSELLVAGRIEGKAGESVLIPTFGRLQADRLLALGLGSTQGFGASQVVAAVREAVGRLLELGVDDAALSLPGDWTGAVPARPASDAALRGAADAIASRSAALRLQLLVPEHAATRAQRGLEAAAGYASRAGIDLDLHDLQSVRSQSATDGRAPRSGRIANSPVYDRA